MSNKSLIEVLKKMAIGKGKSESFAAPQRNRKQAVRALKSDLIKHLAKHIIKITLWPELPSYSGWIKELKACLTELSFKLCRFCVENEEDERVVKKLWFGSKEIMRGLNEVMDEAYWEVKDEIKRENNGKTPHIEYNPFTEKEQNFSDIGFKIKEEKDPVKGIIFTLWLKDTKIA